MAFSVALVAVQFVSVAVPIWCGTLIIMNAVFSVKVSGQCGGLAAASPQPIQPPIHLLPCDGSTSQRQK
jgi:hypothetical protein